MMEGNKNKPRVLFVFGAPCSGKTTFSEKFAKKFGLAYYNLDDLENEVGLTREKVLMILGLVARTGQTFLIEGGINTEKQREEIREALTQDGYIPALIWIQTDVATLRARLKSRFKSVAKAKQVYDEAVKEIEAPSDAEKPIILSGKHTFETQARHVIKGLAELKV